MFADAGGGIFIRHLQQGENISELPNISNFYVFVSPAFLLTPARRSSDVKGGFWPLAALCLSWDRVREPASAERQQSKRTKPRLANSGFRTFQFLIWGEWSRPQAPTQLALDAPAEWDGRSLIAKEQRLIDKSRPDYQ